MYSGSPLYWLVAALGIFGTASVCLAFAFLLPGVGQALVGIWTFVTADFLYQKRNEEQNKG